MEKSLLDVDIQSQKGYMLRISAALRIYHGCVYFVGYRRGMGSRQPLIGLWSLKFEFNTIGSFHRWVTMTRASFPFFISCRATKLFSKIIGLVLLPAYSK